MREMGKGANPRGSNHIFVYDHRLNYYFNQIGIKEFSGFLRRLGTSQKFCLYFIDICWHSNKNTHIYKLKYIHTYISKYIQ